jgi:hypothetical protein
VNVPEIKGSLKKSSIISIYRVKRKTPGYLARGIRELSEKEKLRDEA